MIRHRSGIGGVERGGRPVLPRAEILPPMPVDAVHRVGSRAGEGGRPLYRVTSDAAFLAQLIAARDLLPQARDRRRAEPQDGVAAYRAGLARMAGPLGPSELALA